MSSILHRRPLVFLAILSLAAFLRPSLSLCQLPGSISPLANAEIQNRLDRPMTLYVSVRERSGIPLSVAAIVRLSPLTGGQSLVAPVMDASTATFPNIFGGEYEVQVEAPGYETTTERLSVVGSMSYTAYVYLAPLGTSIDKSKPGSGMIMTPDLQRELDRSFVALNKKDFTEARKHLQKAHKMAPSNPDVLYLLGLIDYTAKDTPSARKQFESVLASYPTHQRSLIMLGQIQVDAGENKEASITLLKAIEVSSVNWQAHYLLAVAYARLGELEKSRLECQRTAELNKDKKPVVNLLDAKLYLMEGRNQNAREAFESFLHNFPKDPGAAEAQKYLARLDEMGKATLKPANEPSPAPHPSAIMTDSGNPTPPAFERPWAPPEVDAAVPPTAPGVSCSLEDILLKTQRGVLRQLSDLEKFGATEHIEHQFIDMYGVPETPVVQDFDYLIFVHHTQQLPYYFDEVRNGAESLYQFPSAFATRGLVSLGFMVIHPVFSQDFQFTCEGLGSWDSQPAWQIHFAQRGDVPSRIRSWSYQKNIYPVPLKGRIWIGANSYNLLHLETGLRDPVPELRLYREQLIVDYDHVQFKSANVELWLPIHAEMYFDMLGKRYHHRHTLSDYVLFDVSTRNNIAAPTQPREPDTN